MTWQPIKPSRSSQQPVIIKRGNPKVLNTYQFLYINIMLYTWFIISWSLSKYLSFWEKEVHIRQAQYVYSEISPIINNYPKSLTF
jgi:hypothetical protein